MSDDRRFQVNRNDVAAKVIDGEAIVMDISSGNYYSITGAGTAIWELIEGGLSVAEVTAAILNHCDVREDAVLGDVVALVARLLEENLLQESPGRAPELVAEDCPTLVALVYAAPTFEKYTDMADMLALDPPMPGFEEEPPWTAGEPAR